MRHLSTDARPRKRYPEASGSQQPHHKLNNVLTPYTFGNHPAASQSPLVHSPLRQETTISFDTPDQAHHQDLTPRSLPEQLPHAQERSRSRGKVGTTSLSRSRLSSRPPNATSTVTDKEDSKGHITRAGEGSRASSPHRLAVEYRKFPTPPIQHDKVIQSSVNLSSPPDSPRNPISHLSNQGNRTTYHSRQPSPIGSTSSAILSFSHPGSPQSNASSKPISLGSPRKASQQRSHALVKDSHYHPASAHAREGERRPDSNASWITDPLLHSPSEEAVSQEKTQLTPPASRSHGIDKEEGHHGHMGNQISKFLTDHFLRPTFSEPGNAPARAYFPEAPNDDLRVPHRPYTVGIHPCRQPTSMTMSPSMPSALSPTFIHQQPTPFPPFGPMQLQQQLLPPIFSPPLTFTGSPWNSPISPLTPSITVQQQPSPFVAPVRPDFPRTDFLRPKFTRRGFSYNDGHRNIDPYHPSDNELQRNNDPYHPAHNPESFQIFHPNGWDFGIGMPGDRMNSVRPI